MKHGTPLSVAFENGQYREYLILVEELIKNTLCKILLSCEYAFVFFSFFLQTWFSQRRKFYIWYQIKKWMICLRFSHDSNFIFLTNVLCSTSLYRYQIYLTLKWPPRSLRYGRHIMLDTLWFFFLCLEVRFLRPLSSFCCSSRSPSKNQLVEKAFFLSLI